MQSHRYPQSMKCHSSYLHTGEHRLLRIEDAARIAQLQLVDGVAHAGIGGREPIEVDVRILAATNRDLEAAIDAERFRRDLFYRLNVVPIHLPELSDRPDDVALLCDYFMERFALGLGVRNPGLAAEAYPILTAHSWPGNVRELANLMVGRELLESIEKRQLAPGDPVLNIKKLSVLNDKKLAAITDLNLTVRQNEILGMAGISGNGQTELSEMLFGMRPPVDGVIQINNRLLKFGSPAASIQSQMGRIPEDRIDTGLLMDLSVEENLILENHSSVAFQTYGLMKSQKIHNFSDDLIKAYNIKTAGRDAITKSLSGGNLQKVMLARELAGEPSLIIASQPTRGLDVGAMEYIHQRLINERERGAGILLISDDLDEIFSLSDRIVVLYEGKIMGEAPGATASREQIGLWMSGVKA